MSSPPIVIGAEPNLNLSATLLNQSGAPVLNGQLIITLCGYGLEMPKIAGTAMYAKVGPVEYTLPTGTTTPPPGIPIWGNDQITPSGTFYTVAVVDDKKNVIQTNMYQFTGSGDIDLSTQIPIIPSQGTATVPPLQFVTYDIWLIGASFGPQAPMSYNQVVAYCNEKGIAMPPSFTTLPASAHFNSVAPTDTVTLTRSAYNGVLIGMLYNGNMLLPNIHYTITQRIINLAFSPYDGDNLYAIYVATTLS
jgi:hypothetical protein